MTTADRLEGALERVRRIIDTASGVDAPITKAEAFDHIVEEMELAGLGPATPPSGRAAVETRSFI